MLPFRLTCQCKRHKRNRFKPWVGKISWRRVRTEEPGGLQSIRSQRIGHNRSDLACMHAISILSLIPRQILKSRVITVLAKVCIDKAIVFPVVTYGCGSWTIKKTESWRIDVFELWCWWTLEGPLDSKEIQSVHPKGNQSWIFIGRTDAEAETPILWPPDAKKWLNGKDPDAEKDRRQKKPAAWEEMIR